MADPAARPWLLRRACDGDFLNGYFAGEVAKVSALHEAIVDPAADDDLIDHAGQLLGQMTGCEGMGLTIRHHPHAVTVFEAHLGRFRELWPTVERVTTAAALVSYLSADAVEELDWPPGKLDEIRDGYVSVLNRGQWCAIARRAVRTGEWSLRSGFFRQLAATMAPRLGLRVFDGIPLPPAE
jgi:hypothetical protein